MEANRKRKYNSAKKAAMQTVVKEQTRTAAWISIQVPYAWLSRSPIFARTFFDSTLKELAVRN
jgi:hypothetical protein